MRVLALSDPHMDFATAAKRALFRQQVDCDFVVVTGDVANDPQTAQRFFDCLAHVNAPKMIVPGNHDEWWGAKAFKRPRGPTFQELCEEHDYICPDPSLPYEVVEGFLLFNLHYNPALTYQEEVETNDRRFFHVKDFTAPLPVKDLPPFHFSVSHMVLNTRLPTTYPSRSLMFYNPDIDKVIRANRSPVHFFGHSHESLDVTLEGVRYVNNCIGYDPPRSTARLADFVVTL